MGMSSYLLIPIPPFQDPDIPPINGSSPTWFTDICICCFFCLSNISSDLSTGFHFQYLSVYSVFHKIFLGLLSSRCHILCLLLRIHIIYINFSSLPHSILGLWFCLPLLYKLFKVRARSYSAFFFCNLLHTEKVFSAYSLKGQMNKQLHPCFSRLYAFHLSGYYSCSEPE